MDFVPLRITTVKAEKSLTFDLYIFFKDQYLCYSSKGNILSEEKLEKLIKQDVADFFIPFDQVDNVTIFLDKALKEATYAEGLGTEERLDVVEGVAATSIEHMSENPNEANFNMTKNAATGLREVIRRNPHALKRLFGKKGHESDLIIKHSLNVCALATRLAEHLKLPEDEIEDLATAALIHDIGITKLSIEDVPLFEKDKDDFSPDERLRYGQHTNSSAKILSEKPFISKRVENLILNHEEDLRGTGPQKLTKLTPSEECLSLCNAFDKRLISTNQKPSEIYKSFQVDYIGRYNLELIQRFELVLKEEGLLE
ncbi:MAG: HD domain-containing protein [Bacteriovoracaceae bacterium]|nr:HD domain-containing protein [Bacteriovoracaceae bacterium]